MEHIPEIAHFTRGDFNEDGNRDLAVANQIQNYTAVLFGNGDGTFQAPVVLGTTRLASAIVVADFDLDGNEDIATGYNLFLFFNTFGRIAVFYGDGQGGFSGFLFHNVGRRVLALDVADVNNDGAPDIVSTGAQSNTIVISRNNGAGLFSTSP